MRPRGIRELRRPRIERDAAAYRRLFTGFGANPPHTAFQRPGWIECVYAQFCEGRVAAPIVVQVEDASGPVALMPLCLRRRLGLNVLEFADFGVCDYNAPVLRAGRNLSGDDACAIVEGIAKALPEVDLIRFRKMPAEVSSAPNPFAALPRAKVMDIGAWSVALPPTRETYEETFLSSSFRKELRKKARRAAARAPLRFAAADTVSERLELFSTLFRQRDARCAEMGRVHSMADPTVRGFYMSALREPSCERLVSISGLYAGDRPVATMLSLHHLNETLVLMTTFESGDWKTCSLGNLIVREGVARAIAAGGEVFDLTVGDEAYKADFGATRRELFYLDQPLSWKGWAGSFGSGVVNRFDPSGEGLVTRALRDRLRR